MTPEPKYFAKLWTGVMLPSRRDELKLENRISLKPCTRHIACVRLLRTPREQHGEQGTECRANEDDKERGDAQAEVGFVGLRARREYASRL